LFQLQQKALSSLLILVPATEKTSYSLLILIPSTAKIMVFFVILVPTTAKACSSFLILVPGTAKEHDLLYLFLFQLQRKAWSFLLILITWSSLLLCFFWFQLQQKSMVFFAYSCSSFSKKTLSSYLVLSITAVKHVVLGLFLFQLQQKTWSFLLFLVPASSYGKKHVILV
jgi:hypothetical protein